MFITRKFLQLCITALVVTFNVYGQSNWSINSSIQYASGDYLYTQRLSSYYLFGGVRFESNDFSAALSIPFIASNGQNISQFGDIYIPNHMGTGSSGMSGMGGQGGGHLMGNGSMTMSSPIENYGIGDLYFYANYTILNQFTSPLGLDAGGYIKFPTASIAEGFGTGKFDLDLSATLRKNFGSFLVYASGGYIAIGDPDSIDYKNPFTFNAGIGKSFSNGDFSVLLSYSLYTKILEAYQMPQELSLGVNIISNDKISYSLIGSAGLSNSTPDYVFSAGIRYNLKN